MAVWPLTRAPSPTNSDQTVGDLAAVLFDHEYIGYVRFGPSVYRHIDFFGNFELTFVTFNVG